MDYISEMQKMFYKDRIGRVYGDFEVVDIEYDATDKKQVWTMRCTKCGSTKVTKDGKDYAKGKSKGVCKVCKSSDYKIAKKEKKRIEIEKKKELNPSMKEHPLYRRWKGIKRRCYQKSDKDYINYGARGIGMCDEWRYNFWSFVDWANNNGYKNELTIDRIDVNGNYEPSNCRWIPRGEQNKNKRNVILHNGITFPDLCKESGISTSMVERFIRDGKGFDDAVRMSVERKSEINERKKFLSLCKENCVSVETVEKRLKNGMSLEEALKVRRYEMNGVTKPLKDWCEEYNITPPAVVYRMNKLGMSFEEAITTEKHSLLKKKDATK